MTNPPAGSQDHNTQAMLLLKAMPELARDVESQLSPQSALETCLRHSTRALGCLGGIAYLPSPDGRRATISCWHSPEASEPFDSFRKLSHEFSLKELPGLPGRVMREGVPVWVEDFIKADPQVYPRASAAIPGIGAAVGVPVTIYGKVAAVLEIIYSGPVQRDDNVLAFLQCAATCVGMAILRCYMKETLTLQQSKFKRDMEDKITSLLAAKGRMEDAARSKNEFLANISHELRTPMHAILSYSDLGKKKMENGDTEKLLKYFTSIHDSGGRLLALLNDLLDLSKLESRTVQMEFMPHDLREIVHTVNNELWPLLQNKKLTLDIVESPGVMTTAEVDKFKIAQVLLNLLSNAIKFSPERGTITVIFEPLVWEDSGAATPAISVMVVDDGVGIPLGEEEEIFNKFIQSSKTKTGAGGTGLGLAICKEIITAHHGVIFAENNVEKGAMMVFQLPLKQPEVCWLPDSND